jgi:hypothetical protein
MYAQTEFLLNELGEFARPHRFTCDQLLFNERPCLALKFMRATWTALSGLWLPCGNFRCPTATAPFFDATAGVLMIFEVHA